MVLGVALDEPPGDLRAPRRRGEKQMSREQRHVLDARGQRRDLDERREARQEVVLQRGRVAVGRADEAKGRPAGRGLAESLVFAAAIEHPEEVRLLLDGELADLVEEQRASVGLAYEPGPLGHAGVGVVLRVAEELRVDERGRERRRVAGHERPRRGTRQRVDRARRELLARTARSHLLC